MSKLKAMSLASSSHADGPGSTLPVIGPAAPPYLHVMSFNLRNAGDGLPDPWAERRSAVAELLTAEQPTVFGTQEGLYHQLRQVADDLPEQYDWIGLGREGGSRGEFAAMYYDTERLEPEEFDHFWLSDTPEVVGSTTWGNEVIRMATWVRFRDRSDGRRFVALNTHLDHRVELAQQQGAELVADRLRRLTDEAPVIVTGDFNVAAQASKPYHTLIGMAGLRDTWECADERVTPLVATFHGYRGAVSNGERIDWILTSPDIAVRHAAINTFRTADAGPGAGAADVGVGARTGAAALDVRGWPSDHWPVQALVELT